MNGLRIVILIMAVTMTIGCATMNNQMASRDFTAMCVAIDRNRDDVIDREEFLTGAKDVHEANQVFRQCDLNKDGVISIEETEQNKKLLQREIMKREALRLLGPR